MANYNSPKSPNGYQLRVTITTRSQSQANNQSVLNWSIKIINPYNHYAIALSTGSLKIAGATVWSVTRQTINTGGAGVTKTLASGTRTVKHASDGTASVAVSGTFRHDPQNSAGWNIHPMTASGTYRPASLAKKPGKPGVPTVSKNKTSRVITVTSRIPSSSSPITGYQIRRRGRTVSGTFGGWIVSDTNSSRQISYTPAYLDGTYQFQSRAKTAAGWGSWSDTTAYDNRDTSMYVRHGGSWRAAIPYVKTGGVWKPAIAYIKDGSTWKIGRT